MSLKDTTKRGQTEALEFEIDVGHPPERVWRALTDPDLLSKWLLPVVDFGLEPGAHFSFLAPPQPGWDGIVHCRVLEVDPLRRLRYAWVVGDLDTVVTFTLSATESGTHLVIQQSGFKPDQKKNFGGARYGWRMMGERMTALLDGDS